MTRHPCKFSALLLAGAFLATALPSQAQFFPGQFGGGGGFGGNNRRNSTSSRQYPVNGTVGDAIFSIDPETRRLIVIADDQTADEIAKVVQNLDQPKPQVLIKVVFMEVTHNNALDLGVEGAWGKNLGNNTTNALAQAFGISGLASAAGSNSFNSFGQPIQGFSPVPPGAGLYTIFAQDYQVTLRAIATAGKAKILSRPSVVARNNQPATITVGQSVPLITGTRIDNFGNAFNTYNYQDVGIILRVTPFIMGTNLVELVVSPETSDLVQDRSQWVTVSSTEQGGVVSAPLINSRTADTVVVTPDGATVIIGGLMQTTKADSESKIPLLGDIPVLGALFRHKIKAERNTELLIFLTPTIIQAPSDMAALALREEQKSKFDSNFTDKELEKFLERIPEKKADESSGSKKKKKKSE